jgi:hypothetical protein
MMLRLWNVDGDESHLTCNEFFETNADLVGSEVEDTIRSLRVGEAYHGGGGAQPEWTVRRVN